MVSNQLVNFIGYHHHYLFRSTLQRPVVESAMVDNHDDAFTRNRNILTKIAAGEETGQADISMAGSKFYASVNSTCKSSNKMEKYG